MLVLSNSICILLQNCRWIFSIEENENNFLEDKNALDIYARLIDWKYFNAHDISRYSTENGYKMIHWFLVILVTGGNFTCKLMNQRTHTQAIPQYFVEIIFQLSKFRKYVRPMIVYMLQHSNWFGFRIEKGGKKIGNIFIICWPLFPLPLNCFRKWEIYMNKKLRIHVCT